MDLRTPFARTRLKCTGVPDERSRIDYKVVVPIFFGFVLWKYPVYICVRCVSIGYEGFKYPIVNIFCGISLF